jgi:hypothetical protein
MNPRQQTLAFADEAQPRVHGTVRPLVGRLLSGPDRDEAIETIKANHGRSDEVRTYRAPDGRTMARRAFHSGGKGMKKAEIEAMGYAELKLPGKERFVRPLTKRARRAICTPNMEGQSLGPR